MNYSKKENIFLTGATGFFGRYLIYQLCEAQWVEKIYVLIRSKKGESSKKRLEELLKDVLFVTAEKQGISFKKIQIIDGDCLNPKLGLSEQSIALLSHEVTLVIHNAAALSFASRLDTSVRNNTTPTWILYEMCCKDFKRKPAFIFVSSLATNSHIEEIPEKLIPFSTKAKLLHDFIKGLPRERCKEIEEFLKEDRLDSYGFSKALAENMIAEHIEDTGGQIPVSFIRPGGINACFRGPRKGWIHNTCFYGQLVYMYVKGQVKLMIGNHNNGINMSPCDLVGNLTMCVCLDLIERKKKNLIDVRVINGSLCSIKNVSLGSIYDVAEQNWEELRKLFKSIDNSLEYNLSSRPWMIPSVFIFDLLFYFFYFFVFIYTLFLGRKSEAAKKTVKTVNYVVKYMKALSPYLLQPMIPLSDSCEQLKSKYGDLYPFEASNIDRDTYLLVFIKGVIIHLISKRTKNGILI